MRPPRPTSKSSPSARARRGKRWRPEGGAGSSPPIRAAQTETIAICSLCRRSRASGNPGLRGLVACPPVRARGRLWAPAFSQGRRKTGVAQHRDREQSRRPQGAVGLFELAGEAGRRDEVADAPNAGMAALAMRDQYRVSHRPEAIAAAKASAAQSRPLQRGFGPTTFQRWRSKSLSCSSSSAGRCSESASMRPPAAAGV
jgi:hypothetical protein